MHLGDAVTAFLAGYFSTCKRSAKTLAAYKIDLSQLRTHLGTTKELLEISGPVLEGWAAQLHSDGYAAVSIRRKFATARVFFTYWVRRGALDKSPLWHIRLDLGRERLLPRSLSPSDAKRLMEQAWKRFDVLPPSPAVPSSVSFLRLRNVAAMEILFATGMRVGELVKLTLPDWQQDDKSFIVRGKGSRQRLAFLPDSRSIKAVDLYLGQRKAMQLPHAMLFVNASGGGISTQGIARALAELARAAQVENHVTPHMIRHTVATLLLRYGADIRIVQEVLGHASIATTQRYTHVSKEHLVSALRVQHPSHHLDITWTPPA